MSRVALVTGGSRGIGRSVSELLGERGYRVAVNYSSRAEAADEVVDKITAFGGEAASFRGDVGDAGDVARLFDAIGDSFGPVEVLVNNAGIAHDDLLVRMSEEAWDEVLRVNLRSVYLCTKRALRGMLRVKWGRVISISSVAGVAGNPGQANYAAAKAGIIGFTKSVAKEIGSRGITANVVAPGFIETDMTAGLNEKIRRWATPQISLGRFGTPSEVASVVGYLASDDASYVTGQVIRVDGGISI